MIKNVLFDLDGTLLDTTEGVLESVKYVIQELGLRELEDGELVQFIGPPIQNSFMKFYGVTENEAQQLGELFRNYYKNKALFLAKPYDGIYEVCNVMKMHGMKLAVATYKREDYAIELLKHFHFDEIFDVMHGADNNNRLKKSDIVQLCMKEMNSNIDDCVLIGDTLHDSLGAFNAGVHFIPVTYGFGFNNIEELTQYPNIGVAKSTFDIWNIISHFDKKDKG
ncbi:phosphoglycolate phosphatase [Lachnospiraceae bacterium A10]|nr:phosphoglycolate phosphatase [Lachnospiraceae bacterium A10]